MLPACSAGAASSALINMLRDGHHGLRLSREELDKVCCWIDLLVPYCGDYTEANVSTEEEVAKYDHFLSKCRRLHRLEERNIEALIRAITAPSG